MKRVHSPNLQLHKSSLILNPCTPLNDNAWMTSPDRLSGTQIFVVMGVAGSGKSTLATMLARACGGELLDADDFHPPENIVKMKSATPLNDADRVGWLNRLNRELNRRIDRPRPVFLACSALKRAYRVEITHGLAVNWIYLKISRAAVGIRMQQRKDHFMPAALLDSQFEALEEPGSSDAFILNAEQLPAKIEALVKNAFPTLPWK